MKMNQVIKQIMVKYDIPLADEYISEVLAPELNIVTKEEQIFIREDKDFVVDYAEYIHNLTNRKVPMNLCKEVAEYMW